MMNATIAGVLLMDI